MEILGYIRVSSQEQAESGLSLQAQKAAIEKFCEYKGFHLSKIVEDVGVSATIPLKDREGGGQLLTEASEGVAALRLDRLFRDAHDCLGITKRWNEQGIALHLLDLGMDTSTAMGRAFLSNAATYAELERNLISERTKDALAQVKINGGVLGTAPMGWERTEEIDAGGRRVVKPIEEEMKTIALCRDLRSKGWTYRQIAMHLTNTQIPTKRGGKWYSSTVRNYCVYDSSSASS